MPQGQEKVASFCDGGSHCGIPENSLLASVLLSTLMNDLRKGIAVK